MPALTTDAHRQAVALERIAAALESFDAPRRAPAPQRESSNRPVNDELVGKLILWLFGPSGPPIDEHPVIAGMMWEILTQATKAETVEWLAWLAERYGFKS